MDGSWYNAKLKSTRRSTRRVGVLPALSSLYEI